MDESKVILGLRLYDLLNVLALQMEDNKTNTEYIQIKAFNTHSKRYNTLTVTLEETQ